MKKVNSKLLDLFVFDVDLHGSCLISFCFLSIFFTESLFFCLVFNCYADFWTLIMLLCLIPLLYHDLKAINIFEAV